MVPFYKYVIVGFAKLIAFILYDIVCLIIIKYTIKGIIIFCKNLWKCTKYVCVEILYKKILIPFSKCLDWFCCRIIY